ncbi:DUF2239 family protein [Microbulbifer hainanensis]|uniref:DUF2239 family protein n=1 Tax=Microbulbifer hainanensis TaxID=2735675 RepID=UPI001867A15F|nr:DUF2239 family protein [Microbulbifer hainanensis]
MEASTGRTCSAFLGHRCIASGPLHQVAATAKRTLAEVDLQQLLVFDDSDSRSVEIDFRGSEQDVLARLDADRSANPKEAEASAETEKPRGRGRPKLGVIAREVTLLPRHWDWLRSQPGGASVALRKLVEEARRASRGHDRRRAAQESCYRFMMAVAGNLPGLEEATRALFAGEEALFRNEISAWPQDVRVHCERIASDTFTCARNSSGVRSQ